MTTLKDRIMEKTAADRAAIEAALRDNLTTYLEIVSNVAGHILFSGGKRFRPLLMVLSARLCGYDGDYDKTFSTIFEYLHTATLLHDDLVDAATLRRGKTVANAIWGSEAAVLVGDFLLARSLSLAAGTGDIRVIQAIGKVTEDMAQGEIHQLIGKGRLDLTEGEYGEVIRRKTAALIEGACRTGALIAKAGDDAVEALGTYGRHLGTAFQMADDLLDYTADTAALGKVVGADLREGKMTLPVIHALARAPETDKQQMIDIIGNKDFTALDFQRLLDLLETHGGIAYTHQQAAREVAQATAALAIFPESETRALMQDLAMYALERKT